MRVIKAPISKFKRRVTRRAFVTRRNVGRWPASLFEARHQARTAPMEIGDVKKHRGLIEFAVIPVSLGFDLDGFMAGKRKAVVFEIGCGGGNLLAGLKGRYHNNIGRVIGLSMHNDVGKAASALIDELRVGDALVAGFPKADVIVSQMSLGYIRDPNFLLKKIENALKPGGVALLHYDQQNAKHYSAASTGGKKPSYYTLSGHHGANFDNFFERLARTGRIGNSSIKIVRPDPEIISRLKEGNAPAIIREMALDEGALMNPWYRWRSCLEDMKKDPLILILKPKKKAA